MKNFNGNTTNIKKRKNSFQTQKFPNIKSILNKHSFHFHKSAKKLRKPSLKAIKNLNPKGENSEELVFLSNANLNIINILNTCISEGFYNEASFINNNNNNSLNNKIKEQKDMGKNKLYKNNNQSKSEKVKNYELKKNKIKNNFKINNNNSNSSHLVTDSSNSKKPSSNASDYYFNRNKKSNYNKKIINEKELFIEGNKNLININNLNKYFSNLGTDSLSLHNYNYSSNISPKQRSFSNNNSSLYGISTVLHYTNIFSRSDFLIFLSISHLR